MKAIDTGIEHGTVTALVKRDDVISTFEVTTLRVDVETYGRHAQVAFTDDWTADASRRDFTMNAIYCNRDGTLFDPLGGIDDLKARHVRFVGHAANRIEEDYLRILRFFRIHAEYGDGPLDAAGLEACRLHLSGLGVLSAERVRREMMRLLVARRSVEVVRQMDDENLLAAIAGKTPDTARFERLCALEMEAALVPDPLLRLAALVLKGTSDVVDLRNRYALTNVELKRLSALASERTPVHSNVEPAGIRHAVYRLGRDAFRDALLFDTSATRANGAAKPLSISEKWEAPVFPLSGEDVVSSGIAPGPEVGRLLRRLEEQWISSGFVLDPEELRKRLQELIVSDLT